MLLLLQKGKAENKFNHFNNKFYNNNNWNSYKSCNLIKKKVWEKWNLKIVFNLQIVITYKLKLAIIVNKNHKDLRN